MIFIFFVVSRQHCGRSVFFPILPFFFSLSLFIILSLYIVPNPVAHSIHLCCWAELLLNVFMHRHHLPYKLHFTVSFKRERRDTSSIRLLGLSPRLFHCCCAVFYLNKSLNITGLFKDALENYTQIHTERKAIGFSFSTWWCSREVKFKSKLPFLRSKASLLLNLCIKTF